jgi:hypothetical protein
MLPPKAGHALWEHLLHGDCDAWRYIDNGPWDPITPLGRVLQHVRYVNIKILHTQDLAGVADLDTDKSDWCPKTGLMPPDMVDLEQAGCFFWPIAGLAPPEPDQRPVPRYLYITIPKEGVPVATLPLDRCFDLSRLEHLDVGFGGPVIEGTDLSWLAVIPTTLQTVRIECADERILRSLLEGLRRQTRLETLDIPPGNGHSIADINPLKYLPTLRRLDLDQVHDLEQLVDFDHQCLEDLSIEANWGERGSKYEGEKLGEFPAHHPARRFADAVYAARAKNPSLLPALKALIIPNHRELWDYSDEWEDLYLEYGDDDDDDEAPWLRHPCFRDHSGRDDMKRRLREEGVVM